MLGAAFGLGFVVGPALGGVLGERRPAPAVLGRGRPQPAERARTACSCCPSRCRRERRAAFAWRRANPLGCAALLRSQPGLLGLAGVNFLATSRTKSLPSTFVLYASYRYGWSERTVGLMLATVGVCSVVVQAALVGRASRASASVACCSADSRFGAQALRCTAWRAYPC